MMTFSATGIQIFKVVMEDRIAQMLTHTSDAYTIS